MRRPALTTLALVAAFIAYIELLAPLVPDQGALAVLITVLVVFGVASYLGARASPWSFAWLIATPIVVPLPPLLYLGGDPAKPRLEYLVYYVMVLVMAVAELLAWLIDKLASRRRGIDAEA